MVKKTEKHHPMAAFRLQVVQPVQPVQGVPVVTRRCACGDPAVACEKNQGLF